jgi:hypothetical protein
VAKTHAVGTHTRSQLATETQPSGQEGAEVFAEPGDLALEVIEKRTGLRIAASYLSGAALQLNCYDLDAAWYEDAGPVGHVEIPHPAGDPEAFIADLIERFAEVRYGGCVSAFRYRCRRGDDPVHVAEVLLGTASYRRVDGEESTGHVLGLVTSHGRGRKRPAVTVHVQPPRHAADCHATSFQIELAIGAAERAA